MSWQLCCRVVVDQGSHGDPVFGLDGIHGIRERGSCKLIERCAIVLVSDGSNLRVKKGFGCVVLRDVIAGLEEIRHHAVNSIRELGIIVQSYHSALRLLIAV